MFAPAWTIPFVRVKTPPEARVMLLFSVTPFMLFIVRLFRLVTLLRIETAADEPPKERLEEELVAKLPGAPAIVGPLSVSLVGPTVKVPDVRVRVPFIDKSAPKLMFLLVLKLFNPLRIAFKVISEPVPIVRLEVTPPVKDPAP
jgi:hypothetical protein